MDQPRLTTTQAARLLGVSRMTVVRMLDRGDLKGAQPGGKGHWRRVLRPSVQVWIPEEAA